MHRLFFWGTIIVVFLVFGAIIDQIFYRLMRLFFVKNTAQVIRLYTFIAMVVILVGGGLWGHFVTRLSLKVKHVEISSPRLPAAFSGFKIAHISDFHIDSFDDDKAFVDEIVEKILAEKPDIICFTGDIVTARAAQLIPFRRSLSRLAASGIPVFSVMGNHDYADYVWTFDEQRRQQDRDSLRLIQKEMGWQMLDNAHVFLRRGADSIMVIGVENIGEPPFTTYGNLSKALGESYSEADSCSFGETLPENPTGETFSILLSHNPSHWRREVLPETDIDLMLAGHTHSMQLSIFGWSPSKYSYREYHGLYQDGRQFLYVNPGLGCTGPKIRVGVNPEVTVIKLLN